MDEARNDQNDLIIGRNAVFEAIKSGREIDRLFVQRGEQNPAVKRLISMAREKGAVIKEVDSKKLDFMCGGGVHQGVALSAAAHEYSTVEDILNKAAEKNEKPFIIICDGVEDTHNLGAVIRTADAAGAHGVIIPKRRSASLNFTVGKTSAGALEYVPVARVANLASTIDELKEKNIWIYGADMDGSDYRSVDYSGGVALVIGSEGRGMSRRPNFLTRPGVWLRAPRVDQSAADYASPITRYTSDVRLREAVAGVLLAIGIGVALAVMLVAWWSA